MRLALGFQGYLFCCAGVQEAFGRGGGVTRYAILLSPVAVRRCSNFASTLISVHINTHGIARACAPAHAQYLAVVESKKRSA